MSSLTHLWGRRMQESRIKVLGNAGKDFPVRAVHRVIVLFCVGSERENAGGGHQTRAAGKLGRTTISRQAYYRPRTPRAIVCSYQ